jgi:hypothetical protein
VLLPTYKSFRFNLLANLNVHPGFVNFLKLFYEKLVFAHAGGFTNKDMTRKAVDAWNEKITAIFPPDRKPLIYEIREGWAPLCRFLNVPQPDAPFPHANDTAFLIAGRRDGAKACNILLILLSVVLCLGAYALGAPSLALAILMLPSLVMACLPIDW